MTFAIVITIVASLLWAITNHIDKYLLELDFEGKSNIKKLLVFATFGAGIVFTPV